jgi:hypothetical protein
MWLSVSYSERYGDPGWLCRYSDVLRDVRPVFDSREGQDFFCVFHRVQISPGTHPVPHPGAETAWA